MRTRRTIDCRTSCATGIDQLVRLLNLTEQMPTSGAEWTPTQLRRLFARVDLSRMFLPDVHLVWIWSLLLQRAFNLERAVADNVACRLVYDTRTMSEAEAVTGYLVARCVDQRVL